MVSSELEGIAAVKDSADRLGRVVEYIDRGETRLRQARSIRDDTIRELRAAGMSRPKVAEAAQVSVAHVAAVTATSREAGHG